MKHGWWLLLAACVSVPRPVPVEPVVPEQEQVVSPSGAEVALRAFVEAVEARRFEVAHGLLSAQVRARYSAQRLGDDFVNDPVAKVRVERIRARLGDGVKVDGARASLEWDAGRAVRLVREDEAWKVAAIE